MKNARLLKAQRFFATQRSLATERPFATQRLFAVKCSFVAQRLFATQKAFCFVRNFSALCYKLSLFLVAFLLMALFVSCGSDSDDEEEEVDDGKVVTRLEIIVKDAEDNATSRLGEGDSALVYARATFADGKVVTADPEQWLFDPPRSSTYNVTSHPNKTKTLAVAPELTGNIEVVITATYRGFQSEPFALAIIKELATQDKSADVLVAGKTLLSTGAFTQTDESKAIVTIEKDSDGNVTFTPNVVNGTTLVDANYTDGTSVTFLVTVTVGEVTVEVAEKVENPKITCSEDNLVTMTTKTLGATIYYTTDGVTTPTKESTKYTEPFALEESSLIKLIAMKSGMISSEEVEADCKMTWTVTLDPNGGKWVSSRVKRDKVIDGKTINEKDPTNGEKLFDGWSEGGNAFDKKTPITKNLTLTAQWRTANATAAPTIIWKSFASNSLVIGSNVVGAELSIAVGEDDPVTQTAPCELDASTFGEVTVSATAKAEDLDLSAKTNFLVEFCTLTFNLNLSPSDTSSAVHPASQIIHKGGRGAIPGDVTVAATKIDSEGLGYSFSSWAASRTGGKAFSFSTPIMEDATLYALWAAWPAGEEASFSINSDNKVVIEATDALIKYSLDDGTEETYSAPIEIAANEAVITAKVTYPEASKKNPVVTKKSIHTITFSLDGGSAAAPSAPIKKKAFDKGSLARPTLGLITKTGFEDFDSATGTWLKPNGKPFAFAGESDEEEVTSSFILKPDWKEEE